MEKNILIVGGYGNVGRIIAAELSEKFPGKVIVAGRNFQKAKAFASELSGRVIPMEIDVSLVSADDGLLDDVGVVIICLDLEDVAFARLCLQRGIDYIDISASYHILSQIERMHEEVQAAGATAVLSVGLAPGLTNLLVKQAQSKNPHMTYADIFLMFGLGEVHGDAAYAWIAENLNAEFTVRDNGALKLVRGFEEKKQTVFPGVNGKRAAYQYNFPEQHVLLRTLGLERVSSWLCFDSAFATRLLALMKKTGLSSILRNEGVQGFVIDIIKRSHRILKGLNWSSEEFVIKVEAGNSHENGDHYESALRGESEARITALVAAKAAEELVSSSFPSGVYHMEELFSLDEFLGSLNDRSLKFEERLKIR